MTKQDFENALRIKKEIVELKTVEDAGFQIDKQHLKLSLCITLNLIRKLISLDVL